MRECNYTDFCKKSTKKFPFENSFSDLRYKNIETQLNSLLCSLCE